MLKKGYKIYRLKSYNYPTRDLFLKYRLLTLNELYSVSLFNIMSKFYWEKLPNALCVIFVTNNMVHIYDTRNMYAPHFHKKCCNVYCKFFTYHGPKI